MKKVLLAFSGGLDTSYCAIYLSPELGLEVYAALVDTGGLSAAEIQEIERRAYASGVKQLTHLDEKESYYQSRIKYMVFGNGLKNNTYPLSVSAERVTQALSIGNFAKSVGADYVAHGSTGGGNDQVRFDMVFQAIIPDVEVITPIRDMQ